MTLECRDTKLLACLITMSLPWRWLTPYIYINRQSGTSRHKLSTRVSGKSQRQIIIQSHQFTIGLGRTSLENTHIPLLWQLCTKHELCVCTWGWLSVAHPALHKQQRERRYHHNKEDMATYIQEERKLQSFPSLQEKVHQAEIWQACFFVVGFRVE